MWFKQALRVAHLKVWKWVRFSGFIFLIPKKVFAAGLWNARHAYHYYVYFWQFGAYKHCCCMTGVCHAQLILHA